MNAKNTEFIRLYDRLEAAHERIASEKTANWSGIDFGADSAPSVNQVEINAAAYRDTERYIRVANALRTLRAADEALSYVLSLSREDGIAIRRSFETIYHTLENEPNFSREAAGFIRRVQSSPLRSSLNEYGELVAGRYHAPTPLDGFRAAFAVAAALGHRWTWHPPVGSGGAWWEKKTTIRQRADTWVSFLGGLSEYKAITDAVEKSTHQRMDEIECSDCGIYAPGTRTIGGGTTWGCFSESGRTSWFVTAEHVVVFRFAPIFHEGFRAGFALVGGYTLGHDGRIIEAEDYDSDAYLGSSFNQENERQRAASLILCRIRSRLV